MLAHMLNTSNVRINPATEDKQDTIKTAIDAVASAVGTGVTLVAKTVTAVTKAVTTPSTAVALVATETFARKVALCAKRAAADNTGNVFIGTSTLDQGVAEGIELAPGDYWEFEAPAGTKIDLATIYIDADTGSDGVAGFYIPA